MHPPLCLYYSPHPDVLLHGAECLCTCHVCSVDTGEVPSSSERRGIRGLVAMAPVQCILRIKIQQQFIHFRDPKAQRIWA